MQIIPLKKNQPASSPPKQWSSQIDGLGFRFQETMSGFIGIGESDPTRGAERGRREKTEMSFEVQIRTPDLGEFLRSANHEAEIRGSVTFAPLGGTFPIQDGKFNLFTIDPDRGVRQLRYAFRFVARDGATYSLRGHKDLADDKTKLDPAGDMTCLFTVVYRGENARAPVYGAGEIYFKMTDLPGFVASMGPDESATWRQKAAAAAAFASFAYGNLRDEYVKDARLFYDTKYENLVLSGILEGGDGKGLPFFFVSGAHDRGFPWGDNEVFWDLLLAVGDGRGGFRRYAITHRVLEGLKLDLKQGTYRYRGPVFELREGYAASFSQMRAGAQHLRECQAELEIDFEARAFDPVPVSSPLAPELIRKMASKTAKAMEGALPGERPLGIYITPHTVKVRRGSIRLLPAHSNTSSTRTDWTVDVDKTFGEGERGGFRNIKEPKMLYSYLCAVRPGPPAARVQILSRTLRDERQLWVKDALDSFLGSIVSHTSSSEMLMENEKLTVRPLPGGGREEQREALFKKLGEPIIEVNNDQFPTAVFQRRIVEVQDPSGERCLALEEDMSLMRLSAISSTQKTTVAAIKDDDKLRALDRVLAETAFDRLVEARLAGTQKKRSQFAIAIKPNFMFAYNKRDHTTYTDPELVHHLVKRLRARGFKTIQVVEAQSTYGEFFDHRSVRDVATYLGYDERLGFQLVDMTEDATETRDLGPHLGKHPVSKAWRDADFRVSFAKNKTHAYAYYTLTLKNIYGALPLANKFKEYHCRRGIYETAIDYLKAFPVHYGLVDAYISADGPFGIFADPQPNFTRTIIGGENLVAVDWVAAGKMGVDPMLSRYMKAAVQTFGKPEIEVLGDKNPYRPWLNVPVGLTVFTHQGIDADYFLGYSLYSASAQMDESYFRHKNKSLYMWLLRRLTLPLRQVFFVHTGENA